MPATPTGEHPSRNAWAKRRRYWIPAIVLCLGLASILLLVGAVWVRDRLTLQDVALMQAVGELEARAATAHLWLEEYVSGDDVHGPELRENLDRSRDLIASILGGGEVARGRYVLRPVEDPDLRARAGRIGAQVDEFRRIAERRQVGYERGEAVGIGSAIDVEYDRVFLGLIGTLHDLEALVSDDLQRAQERASLLLGLIMGGWMVIVLISVGALFSLERRRALAERALRESEAQLRHSQKMDAIGRLAGGLAHDINNYLAAIRTHAEVARLKLGDERRVARAMDSVIATSSRAAALIDQLLQFSRRQPLQPRVVHLNEIVRGLDPMLRGLIGEDVVLTLDLAGDLWNVKIDPSQVEQVVVNLVVNSREAMPRGGRVTIRTANRTLERSAREPLRELDPGDYVVLTVSDTGAGIPPEIRDRIFEPFVTTKNRASSSGLGLSTVYGVVRQSRGGVHVDSKPRGGATFEILLPRTLDPEIRPHESEAVRHSGSPPLILLVEDNDDLRDVTREALEMRGFRVDLASNGEEALRRFGEGGDIPDLVISDVVMPGMSGPELCERLRRKKPELRVIFVSGHPDDVVVRYGLERDSARFLRKPFSMRTLVETIEAAL